MLTYLQLCLASKTEPEVPHVALTYGDDAIWQWRGQWKLLLGPEHSRENKNKNKNKNEKHLETK